MIDRLAMTTDYVASCGDPTPYLRGIAEAGFGSIHWCHQWNTDFIYGSAELDALSRLLGEFGLSLNDLHASHGVEKAWGSPIEYPRRAGVELVENRIDMTRRLGGDTVIIHIPPCYNDADLWPAAWDAMRRSLDELRPCAVDRGVRIALENSHDDNMDIIERALAIHGPEYLGLCYDSGHGCMAGNGLDRLEANKDRLVSLHLHDSDGTDDKHWPPMTGSVDWPRLARIVATSGYSKKVMSIESVMRHSEGASEAEFLKQCIKGGTAFAEMVASHEGNQ